MKKVAIITKQMVTGGVERCLITMLKKYSSLCDVTLFLMASGGELYNEIPSNIDVQIIPDILESWKKRAWKSIVKGNFRQSFKIINNTLKLKKTSIFSEQCRLLADSLPKIDKKYDIAISYYTPVSFPVVYTLNNVTAKKKIIWLHTDLEKMGIDLYEMYEEHLRYDCIVGVSEYISNQMKRMEPDNATKVLTIYNCYDIDSIIKKSEKRIAESEMLENKMVFVTVGRLSPQKRQIWIPGIAQKLKFDGFRFCWLIIGDGENRREIQKQIECFSVADEVILLGNKENPYPYMKQCDIYIQTSEYEGFCTTTFEAKILNKVVLTTDVSGAREQFNNEQNGLIVESSPEKIYQGIKRLLCNPILYNQIKQNAQEFRYNDSPFYYKIFGE